MCMHMAYLLQLSLSRGAGCWACISCIHISDKDDDKALRWIEARHRKRRKTVNRSKQKQTGGVVVDRTWGRSTAPTVQGSREGNDRSTVVYGRPPAVLMGYLGQVLEIREKPNFVFKSNRMVPNAGLSLQ